MGKKIDLRKLMRILSVSSIVLLLLTGALLLTREHWKQMLQDNATANVMHYIESGYANLRITQPPPEIEGEDYDFEAMEAYEELTGRRFASPEEIEAAQQEAEGHNLMAKGVLTIPTIDLKLPILNGTTKVDLRYGAGWFIESAELGQPGNCLIFGHRMKAYGKLFNRLDEMKVGDTVDVADMETNLYTYTVVEISELEPKDVFKEVYKRMDGRYLSLITCTPVGVGSHRLIIWCEILD